MAILKGQNGTKTDRKIARAEYIGNTLSDTGTGVLNALKTFGMSAIGDAINGISPKAADAVQKYTLGIIPHTSEAEYLANRPNAENKWLNRTHAAGSAAASQATGAMLTKAIPMAVNAVSPYISKAKGLLTRSPQISKSVVDNTSGIIPYKNAEGIPSYMPDDEFVNIVKQAKADVKSYINDPRYKAVVDKNEAMARRLNSPTTTRSGKHLVDQNLSMHERRVELANRPVKNTNPTALENEIRAGSKVEGRLSSDMFLFGNEKPTYSVELPRFFSKERTARAARHEFLHPVHPGEAELMTNLERSKLDRAFKSMDEIGAVESKYGLEPWYIKEPSERITNSFDLASDLGIQKFQKYPGMEAFKRDLDAYTGSKEFMKESYKLNTPRDYKRVWDLLSGTLIGGTGVAVGLNAAKGEPKQNKGGLLKRNKDCSTK